MNESETAGGKKAEVTLWLDRRLSSGGPIKSASPTLTQRNRSSQVRRLEPSARLSI